MDSRFVKFLILLFLLMAYTLYKTVQLSPEHKYLITIITLLFFILMFSGTWIGRKYTGIFDEPWFITLSWISSICIAFWSTYIFLSLIIDLLSLLSLPIPINPERRQFLLYSIHKAVFALSGGLTVIGAYQAVRGPKVVKTEIKIDKLPEKLKGLTIAQISDLHIGPTIRKNYVKQVVEQTNALNPDLIFLTGDIADALVSEIEDHLKPLSELKAKHGEFYVTGNHEYYWRFDDYIKEAKELNFTPLINENRIVSINGHKVMIAGVTDPAGVMAPGHTPDIHKAMNGHDQAEIKILLSHRPDSEAFEADALGFDLQFSGHTHNGQYFPFNMIIHLFQKYTRGLYQVGDMWLYVSPGTGYWGPASRLGVQSEISLIKLV